VRTDSPALPVASPPPPPPSGPAPWRKYLSRRYPWREYPWPVVTSVALVAVVNVTVLADLPLPPFIGPAIGFWFILIQPVYLLYTTSLWGQARDAERLGYSLAGVIFGFMLAGLAADLVLPVVGLDRPLDPRPVVLLADAITVGLYLLRRRYPGQRPDRRAIAAVRGAITPRAARLLAGSGLTVVLAIMGANRLNNDAGDQVSLLALGLGVLTVIFLLLWRHEVTETVIMVSLYLLSLALLLMTSLRGWYVTGHDIQTEYQVFQLTQANGRWEIASFHNAYNACLSITILPTELADILRVDGPYIYKVFFQLIFALCPVLVYAIARRYWPVATAILACVYFISFPTFFTDMPFINRQEIGLLFVAVAVLTITNASWDVIRRRLTLIAACVAVEMSHYSSMYIFLGILAVAWVIQRVLALRKGRTRAAHAEPPPWISVPRVIGIGTVVAVAVVTIGWGFLATQSAGAVLTDAKAAVSGLLGHSAAARSGNVSYSILFGKTATPQEVLNDYTKSVLKIRAATKHDTSYLELPSAAATPIKAVAQPALPLTSAGRLLADAGVPVAGLNTAIRLAAADAEQVFVAAGLIAFAVVRRFRKRVGWEFLCLGIGAVVMLAVVTVVPDLSVDYGLLRVFQEALIMIAPVVVTGSMAIFRPLGATWAPRVAAGVAVAILISTTGLLPQLLGGYQAQLNLNNSGQYYDSYYTHPQEAAGASWLARQNGVLPANVEATHASTRFLFTTPGQVTGQQFVEDAFPPLLRQRAWVVVDYSILHTGLATATYDGDIIPYRYPVGFLSQNLNLVYNNAGVEIYRAGLSQGGQKAAP
jgi:uncharacterized membrane protein